jgi:hypothetical protein
VNSFTLSGNVKTGLLTLKKSTTTADYTIDSSYTIGVGTIDVSNILLKKYSTTDADSNIQIIDTSLGILGNMYVSSNFAVGKTANTAYMSVDISGNMYADKISVSTTSTNTNYKLELSGNMYQTNGLIWQF